MADQPVSLGAIHKVACLLEDEKVPYAFIGGVALNAWALPRATFDLDLAASIPRDSSLRLLARFEREGFVLDEAFERGFRDSVGGMEQVHLHLPVAASLLAVDIFFAETPFLRSVVERAVRIELDGRSIEVCTPADLILFKLVADRPKDRLDARNILVVQGTRDLVHMEHWANELGVSDRLERLLSEPR